MAVDGVSFSLRRGESLGLVGESGAGKTTVGRMIVGLEQPDSGEIVLAGRDRSRPARSSAVRRRRGREAQIVFQDPYSSLDPRQRLGEGLDEILRFHFHLTQGEAVSRRNKLLEMVGLDLDQARMTPKSLSGGERQRVAVARALAPSPQVLILDEAVSSLDVSIQAQVLNLLAEIRETQDISYIFITHDLGVVRQVTDRMIVMHRGRIAEEGDTASVIDDPSNEYTKLLRSSVPGPGWRPTRLTTRMT
jgi:oligopeptide transport system ATP-binding protein